MVFRHACKMGLEGIVSKRLGSRYISGRSRDWLKFKNPNAPAVNCLATLQRRRGEVAQMSQAVGKQTAKSTSPQRALAQMGHPLI
jgi:ATP-dependent DNA ligase